MTQKGKKTSSKWTVWPVSFTKRKTKTDKSKLGVTNASIDITASLNKRDMVLVGTTKSSNIYHTPLATCSHKHAWILGEYFPLTIDMTDVIVISLVILMKHWNIKIMISTLHLFLILFQLIQKWCYMHILIIVS